VRIIEEISLYEVSLVDEPDNPYCTVTEVER
jgi:hypothetical protein